jgi:hypothetical protein
MNCKRLAFVAAMTCWCAVAGQVDAQSFLERLGEQLSQQLSPPPPPPPPPAPAPGETLPPPRETIPGNSHSRATLGIRVGPVTEELVRNQQLVVRKGAAITGIERGSAADRAGLPLGGVIVAFDGRRIDTPEDLAEAVQLARPGTDVELTYYDRNKLGRKKVHLAAVPGGSVVIPHQPNRPVTLPPPLAPPPASAAPPSNLERDLGGGGTRPLLGKIGKIIDGLATPPPPGTAPPAAPPPPPAQNFPTGPVDVGSEIAALRQQLAELTKEVESLRKQVAALESQVSEKK